MISISLEGRVAVVTGAASGIGRAASLKLAEAGARVALLDIEGGSAKKTEEEIIRRGGTALFFRCDVTSIADCGKAAGGIIGKFGRIDILINCAGCIVRKDVLELGEGEWNRVIDVNLKSVFFLSQKIIPHMKRNGGGSIINTGSGWGLKGGPKAAAYCAAKAGVVNLTRAMAIDFGKDNIRVNCVCPGDVETPLLYGEADQLGRQSHEFLKEAADRPLGRVGQPREVAEAFLYFASDLSLWTTGSILVVDGGGLA